MLSHLGEEGKEAAKEKAIRDGLVSEADIEGNDAADVLAKAGVDMHESNNHHAEAARDRKTLTICHAEDDVKCVGALLGVL